MAGALGLGGVAWSRQRSALLEAETPRPDVECPFIKRSGLSVLAEVLVQARQIVKTRSHLNMIRTEGPFPDLQTLIEQRSGGRIIPHELVQVRNQADNMVHATEKALKDLEGQLQGDEKQRIEVAITELKDAMKGDDKAAIEAKTAALTTASSALIERAYTAANPQGGSATAEGASANASSKNSDDVVDAEFEEVKDDKSK